MSITLDNSYFDKKYDEIPKDVLKKATKILNEYLSQEDKAFIIDKFNRHGKVEWMMSIPRGHFEVGMAIRNLLRDKGLSDECLPDKNWDDYYIQVIEKALNLQ